MARRGRPTNVYSLDRFRFDLPLARSWVATAVYHSVQPAALAAGVLSGEVPAERICPADEAVLEGLANGCSARDAAIRSARCDTIALGDLKREATIARKRAAGIPLRRTRKQIEADKRKEAEHG